MHKHIREFRYYKGKFIDLIYAGVRWPTLAIDSPLWRNDYDNDYSSKDNNDYIHYHCFSDGISDNENDDNDNRVHNDDNHNRVDNDDNHNTDDDENSNDGNDSYDNDEDSNTKYDIKSSEDEDEIKMTTSPKRNMDINHVKNKR